MRRSAPHKQQSRKLLHHFDVTTGGKWNHDRMHASALMEPGSMLARQTLLRLTVAVALAQAAVCSQTNTSATIATISLPEPRLTGPMSLERAISKRRSVREFSAQPLTVQQIGQLCWAAQGITDSRRGFRAAPSAGALYPLELYLVTPAGLYHYVAASHKLDQLASHDLRPALARAALGQTCISKATATMVITAVQQRTAAKYGPRAQRYCLLEAGHAAQNVLLQAVALGLAAVPVGAFHDAQVHQLLGLS
ncbi:MAG: SagB/ThcOx family dehydrogenase, partial [Phycisphaerae bacterium]